MTTEELIANISAVKLREKQKDLIKSMQDGLNQSATKESFQRAVDLLMSGIKTYQDDDDYSTAIGLLDKSIKLFPTADAYYNKGVINHCVGNHSECFKAQSAAIMLDSVNIPKAYFYRANSLYDLCSKAKKDNKQNEIEIIDFVIQDLKMAASLGETNALLMINDITAHKNDLERERQGSKTATIVHKDIIQSGKRVVVKFKQIFSVVLETKPLSEEITQSNINDEKKGGLLEVGNSIVKVYETIRDTHMKELISGKPTKITYNLNGDILEIRGITTSWLDGSDVDFRVYRGIQAIGNYKVSDTSNYYVDVQPSARIPKFKSNYLLLTVQLNTVAN